MGAHKRIIEVDDATANRLEARAEETGIPVSELVARLVANDSVSLSEEEIAELDRQWAAVEAGEAPVPHGRVVRWLETWGTADFRPWNG